MQVVPAVIGWKYLSWVSWVAYYRVEIDHAIEFAACANPLIDLLPHSFLLGRVKRDRWILQERILERRIGGTDNPHPFCVGSRNELAIAGDHVLGSQHVFRRSQ